MNLTAAGPFPIFTGFPLAARYQIRNLRQRTCIVGSYLSNTVLSTACLFRYSAFACCMARLYVFFDVKRRMKTLFLALCCILCCDWTHLVFFTALFLSLSCTFCVLNLFLGYAMFLMAEAGIRALPLGFFYASIGQYPVAPLYVAAILPGKK